MFVVQFLGIFHLRYCLCLCRIKIYVTIERDCGSLGLQCVESHKVVLCLHGCLLCGFLKKTTT